MSDAPEVFAHLHGRRLAFAFVDGLHTFEAVKNDFDTWKQHVRAEGVILFHDTAEEQFGVKDFFATLPSDCCFSFACSHGLGIYTKNKGLLEQIKAYAS